MLQALGRVIEAGQHLVTDRIDPTRVELQGELDRNVSAITLALFAAMLFLGCCLLGVAALGLVLAPWVPLPLTLAVAAASSGAGAWALLRRSEARRRRPELAPPATRPQLSEGT